MGLQWFHDIMRQPGQVETVHPNQVKLRPPVNVSPYIRFCRWGALTAGIVWGAYRYGQLKTQHIQIRDYEHNQLMHELAMQNKIKNWMYLEEMEILFKEIGLDWTPEFKDSFGLPSGDVPK